MDTIKIGKFISEARKSKNLTQALSGAICALLISFITALYSLIWTSDGRVFDEFFSGMIKGISSASLLVGIFLIFYTWVKYAQNNK